MEAQSTTINFDHPEIRSEYERWRQLIGNEDPYQSSSIPGLDEVVRAHFLIVDYFYGKQSGLGQLGLAGAADGAERIPRRAMITSNLHFARELESIV